MTTRPPVPRWGRHVHLSSRDPVGRLYVALGLLSLVILVGSVGYWMLGLTPLDAVYMTVITITTVGYREIGEFGDAEQLFTIVLLLVGVGVVLYTLTLLLQTLLEGQLGNAWRRRRMQADIDALSGHAIICGYGRVGRATAHQLARSGVDVVVIDLDPDRLVDGPYLYLVGNASDDALLRRAGLDRADLLVATLDTDPESIYVVLSARSLNPDLRIIARARTDQAEAKFLRAGADQVVNPQRIGGNRIASFALSPRVVDFLDVVMHQDDVEFNLEDVVVVPGAELVGVTVAALREQEAGGPTLLALRSTDGTFVTNPAPDVALTAGDVLIAVGTPEQIEQLRHRAEVAR